MFQLNGYNAGTQMKWYGKNIVKLLGRLCVSFKLLLFLPVSIFYLYDEFSQWFFDMWDILFYIFLAISIIFSLPKKSKKKLVFTPRVIRMMLTSALIFLGLFFAIYNITIMCFYQEYLTVHYYLTYNEFLEYCYFDFICESLLWSLFFTPFIIILANFINKPIEKFINNHYINDAKRIIDSHKNLITIGITGSYGKTSTKYYLNELLSVKYNVLMTPESYNTTMGVVKTVRNSLSAMHEVFVCEMGAKRAGEIKEICDIVNPKHSLIASIGEQHLESFKSIENIIKTKFEIADAITDGQVFLNYNNEHIRNHNIDKNKITYGIGDGKNYYADNIKISEKGTSFVLNIGNESEKFETALIGEHNVENIVGAIAIAHFMGISLSELYLTVKRLKPVPHRMELISSGSRVIIDDSFNSNPIGAKAALEMLKMFEGLRFLLTPGMVELGGREFKLNKELGEKAADCCDYAVLIGEKQAIPIAEGLKEKGFPADRIYIVKSLIDGMSYVDSIVSDGKKIILLENDLPDNY
jgi:UDP-N-acetylmuramoyl-tripeptide--D-alanyl-D-alanine ligase